MDGVEHDVSPTSIPMVTRMDVPDFHRRWQAARSAALRQTVGAASRQPDASEVTLLQQLPPEQSAEVLKTVYYNARKFGRSALRYFALLWDTHDVRDVLAQADVPCLQGQWQTDAATQVTVERHGCSVPQQCGTLGCAYWHEAIDGLLMGLGDTVRHARHRSVGHGDDRCRDVFTPRAQQKVTYGPVPAHLTSFLTALAQQYVPAHMQVTFVGYAAGVVYYQVTTPTSGCGHQLWPTIFQRAVAQTYPTLRLQDVAPVAVLG